MKKAGGEVPKDRVIDGHDIWDVLTGTPGARSPYDALYYYKRIGNAAEIEGMRQGDWKLRIPLKVNHDRALGMGLTDYVFTSHVFDEEGHLPPMQDRLRNHVGRNQRSSQAAAARETVALYNLKSDPAERYNLAEHYPDRVEAMTRQMRSFDEELRLNSRPIGEL